MAANTTNEWAIATEGLRFFEQGKYDKALECFDRALKINPNFVHGLICKADTLNKMGKPEEALRCCEKTIVLAPENPYIWFCRGEAHELIGDYKKAIESIRKAEELFRKEGARELVEKARKKRIELVEGRFK